MTAHIVLTDPSGHKVHSDTSRLRPLTCSPVYAVRQIIHTEDTTGGVSL